MKARHFSPYVLARRYWRRVRPIVFNGKTLVRYSGEHLRAIRAERGVGRPLKAGA